MDGGGGFRGRAVGFGCLAVLLMAAVAAAALWVIFAWDVNQP